MAVIVKADIESLCILETCLSLRLTTCNTSPGTTEILRGIKGRPQEFTLSRWRDRREPVSENERSGIVFQGQICSLNLGERLHLVIHAEKIKTLIFGLIEMMDSPVALKFFSPEDRELLALVAEAAAAFSLGEKEMLYHLSSFTARDGREVEGKRSILALSERQKSVIKSKLERLLRESREKGDAEKVV